MTLAAMSDVANDAPALIANLDAEAALLGAMMNANQAIDRVADKLTATDFAEPLFGRIFSAIIKEHSLGNPANPITLRPYFEGDTAMLNLGGPGFLAQLTGSGAGIVGLAGFTKQIAELAKKRRLVESLTGLIAEASDYERSSADIAAGAETALAAAMHEGQGKTELGAGECITAALASIERHDPGIRSHIQAIDNSIGPIRRGNLAILAGRPGMGKTAVALCYAKEAARTGKGVLFISLEMTAEELGERIVTDETFDEETGAGVPYDHIVNGQVSRDEMRLLVEARDRVQKMPLQVVDIGSLKVGALATMVRRWKRRYEAQGKSLDLVVVDYLQLLSADEKVSGQYEVVTIISKALKTIAKDNDLGVLALAQLSRKVEERPDRRPMLSDLRDSGQIEQDADIVLFLYREEYYLKKSEPNPASPKRVEWEQSMADIKGEIEFICAKRRKGAERTTRGRFYGGFQAVRG